MDKAVVERALRALAEIGAVRTPAAKPPTSEPSETGWPSESPGAERRFGQPHAKLFPFIGRKMRTPSGPGTLIQVFAERVTVLLDSELGRCSFFRPAEIEPVSRELL